MVDPLSDRLLAARMLLSRIATSNLFSGTDQRLHKARFAKLPEVASLVGREAPQEQTSLTLGVGPYDYVLRVAPNAKRRELGNMLVVAPTRGGKGLLAVSQLLTWPHSVVVNDIKGDLFEQTAGYRSTLGPVFVIDPRGVGHRFDPMRSFQSEDDLRAMAVHFLYKTHEREDPFTKRGVKMLTAIFRAGVLERQALIPYAAHLLHLGPEETVWRLQTLSERFSLSPHENLATRVLDRKFEDADYSDRYLHSTWSQLASDMDPITTETVIRSVAASDFTAEELLLGKAATENGQQVRKPVTIYLRWPERRLLALSPLVRLFWSSLIDELVDLYDQRHGQDCNPVLMLIDEAGSAPVPALPEFAATVVGRGITLWAAFQDLNQARSIYGHDRARTLMNNMETQVFYRQAGLETSEYIEKRLGRKSEYAHSKTSHEGADSQGEAETGVPLMTAQDISELDDTEIIVLHRKLKPIRATRMDWREYPKLLARTKIPLPCSRVSLRLPICRRLRMSKTIPSGSDPNIHDSSQPAIRDLSVLERRADPATGGRLLRLVRAVGFMIRGVSHSGLLQH